MRWVLVKDIDRLPDDGVDRDREVRLQGDWGGKDPSTGMPDHYTKSKLTITLGMVGS